jgi:hypothetical protein
LLANIPIAPINSAAIVVKNKLDPLLADKEHLLDCLEEIIARI